MMASNNDVSLGNILETFPEFVMLLLPYIADRTVFNSIASCNRDTNEQSKVITPPWPIDFQLPASDNGSDAVWSPDGTRVAYTCRADKTIAIVDQRYGIIHRINHNDGLDFCDFKFSPDGRFLVSADEDGIIELWNNDVVGNYEQFQRWNIGEDVNVIPRIDISACSKYIVVASYWRNRVVVINIENGEIIRSLTPQPVMDIIFEVIFSVDYRAVFIYGRYENSHGIKLWRPYLDDADEGRLITLWEQKNLNLYHNIIVSNDKMMIAIQESVDRNKGWLLSIDSNYSCTVQKLNVPGSDKLFQFTSDDECIISATKKGLRYWNIAEKKFTENKESLVYNEKTMEHPSVLNCSPTDHCQLIIFDDIEEEESPLYMKKSIFRHQNRIG